MFSTQSPKSAVIWLTGLSGSGKTTIAKRLSQKLDAAGIKNELIDGDDLRKKFPGLGFSKDDRLKQAERAIELVQKIENTNTIIIVALITPYAISRTSAKLKCQNYLEVYLSTSLKTCIERDPKGLYKKALSGELQNFTGISDPYEIPESPDLVIDTETTPVEDSVQKIEQLLNQGSKN